MRTTLPQFRGCFTRGWAFLLLTILACCAPPEGRAEDYQALFRRANELYQQQNYSGARTLYTQILQAGVHSPEVHYNLANTAARLGRPGEAVLHYEKARRLAPRDADVLANLRRVAPPGNDPEPFILAVPFHWLIWQLSLKGWVGGFLLLFLATGAVGALLLSRVASPGASRVLLPGVVLLGALTLFWGIFAGAKFYGEKAIHRQVVMRSDQILRSGPGENFSQLAPVAEGAKVRRLEFADDPRWARVELPSGQTGYMLSDSLSVI